MLFRLAISGLITIISLMILQSNCESEHKIQIKNRMLLIQNYELYHNFTFEIKPSPNVFEDPEYYNDYFYLDPEPFTYDL